MINIVFILIGFFLTFMLCAFDVPALLKNNWHIFLVIVFVATQFFQYRYDFILYLLFSVTTLYLLAYLYFSDRSLIVKFILFLLVLIPTTFLLGFQGIAENFTLVFVGMLVVLVCKDALFYAEKKE